MNTVFKNKLFRKTLISDSISTMGDAIFYIVLLTYASNLAQKKSAILLVTLSFAFSNFTHFFFGALSDKTKSKALKIIVLAFLRAGIFILIAGLLWLMQKNQSLIIFTVTIILITTSTILGNFVDALYTPIFPKIVDEDEIESAMGISMSLIQGINTLSNFFGASLLICFTFSQLAFVNAISFLISGFILYSILPQIKNIEHSIKLQDVDKGILKIILDSFMQVKSLPIFGIIKQFILINILCEPVFVLFVLLYKNGENKAFWISLLLSLFAIGNILGNILGSKFFSSYHLGQLAIIDLGLIVLLLLGILVLNLPVILVFQFCVGFMSGTISPKFSVEIIRTIPENNLATISSSLNAILLFSGAGFSAIITFLIQFLSINLVVSIMIALTIINIIKSVLKNSNAELSLD
ncbi:MAG: MFS transporter [Pseudolactococcus laudensis]